jgi:hypothetical protein
VLSCRESGRAAVQVPKVPQAEPGLVVKGQLHRHRHALGCMQQTASAKPALINKLWQCVDAERVGVCHSKGQKIPLSSASPPQNSRLPQQYTHSRHVCCLGHCITTTKHSHTCKTRLLPRSLYHHCKVCRVVEHTHTHTLSGCRHC